VRRERLVEYEEKIYDQRRLISDKEAFYEALLKPRRKRPAHMTIEEFQTQRRQEFMMEERKNLKRLEEETAELAHIEKAIKQDNRELQRILDRLEAEDLPEEELETLALAIQKNPCIYGSLDMVPSRKDEREEMKKLTQGISAL
jgi:type II secretory pathway component HofQ